MGDYTDQDRERSQLTLTLVEQSIKQNDERHVDVKKILEKHDKKFDKHEEKIQKNRNLLTKVMAIGTFIIAPITAFLAMFGKSFFQ